MPDLKEIEDLIELMRRSGVSELSLELPDYKVSIKRALESEAAPAPTSAANAPKAENAGSAQGEAAADVTIVAEVISVVSPVVGVFHNGGMEEPRTRVNAGDRVEEGQLLAVIEAMKVPNEVRAPASGVVAQVLVEDGAPVAYGDRLFLIQPVQEDAPDDEPPVGVA